MLLGIRLLLLMSLIGQRSARPPHIIFILADDLGWGDVGFHGGGEVRTPHIDALAREGATLHHYYGDWLCTPSRAALMTGRYALRHGLQHGVIHAGERSALPLNHTLLPQHLRSLGYATHMVGKWHLGYYLRAHMPTERGFDSFLGYANGVIDYYDYTNCHDGRPRTRPQDHVFCGSDLFNGTEPLRHFRGQYATQLFTERALKVIDRHDPAQPLFLYFSHLAVHGSGGSGNVVQAPPEHVARFSHIRNLNRRIFAGMVAALDDSVGAVVAALGAKGMLGESVVVFCSDNGGETDPAVGGFASNAPLRGKKQTLWEGGLRVPALVFAPSRLPPGTLFTGLVHVSDWLPTLYSAAGGDPATLGGPLDGVDQWRSLTLGLPGPRSEILHNSDPLSGQAALRRGHLKLLRGGSPGECPPGPPLAAGGDERNRVRCPWPLGRGCDPSLKPCLFNVTEDPCETNDLADRYPEVVSAMLSRIEEFSAAPPQAKPLDPLADPACHNFAFVPWMEPGHFAPDACLGFSQAANDE